MGKKNYNYIVKNRARDLEMACFFLKNTLGDAPWLHKISYAASTIRRQCKGDDWYIEIADMDIPIENPRHLKPSSLADKLKMFVSIKMEGSGKKWKANEDCINTLGFSVSIVEKEPNDNTKVFNTGFHIDKTDDSDDPTEIHPMYHVHFVNGSMINGSEALSMDVPRLMHHPVDVFLGILLVFAFYNPTTYKSLQNNHHFMGLCRESINHILVPYFSSLSNVLSKSTQGRDVNDYAICPYLAQ